MPALPSWLTTPLWDQFTALLPARLVFRSDHPLGGHRRRIPDRIVFDKLIQVLRFGCGYGYEAIADTACSASTIRNRRDEWIKAGLFAQLKQIALEAYDRIVGLRWSRSPWTGASPKPPARLAEVLLGDVVITESFRGFAPHHQHVRRILTRPRLTQDGPRVV